MGYVILLGALVKQRLDDRHHVGGAVFAGDTRSELPGVLVQVGITRGDAHGVGESVDGEAALADGRRADAESMNTVRPERTVAIGR